MRRIKHDRQRSFTETAVEDPKALQAMRDIEEAERQLDDMRAREIAAVQKRLRDATERLREALPIPDEPTYYRVGEALVRVTPPQEPSHVEFERRPKPRLDLVDDAE